MLSSFMCSFVAVNPSRIRAVIKCITHGAAALAEDLREKGFDVRQSSGSSLRVDKASQLEKLAVLFGATPRLGKAISEYARACEDGRQGHRLLPQEWEARLVAVVRVLEAQG